LVKFFLYENYLTQINEKNTYGTRGKLATAFAELVQEMYLGESKSVAPWDVKMQVARKAIQFQGFAQHDSQEMLSMLLETMHEDCNQVSKKPYIEQKDSNYRPDFEVAQDSWQGFLQREKSIFVDLFYGQLKSRVQCSVCKHVSITFDPYNVLSVPVP
jgi:ubiquitin C-terminal hydrolase